MSKRELPELQTPSRLNFVTVCSVRKLKRYTYQLVKNVLTICTNHSDAIPTLDTDRASYARRRSKKSKPKRNMNVHYYAALLPRRGPHIASHSVRLSVRLSVRPVIVAIGYVFSAPLASRRAT